MSNIYKVEAVSDGYAVSGFQEWYGTKKDVIEWRDKLRIALQDDSMYKTPELLRKKGYVTELVDSKTLGKALFIFLFEGIELRAVPFDLYVGEGPDIEYINWSDAGYEDTYLQLLEW